MPSHPASAIPTRIEGLPGPFQLRSISGAPIRLMDRDELDIYVEAGVVEGHWNSQKFKYAKFLFEEHEVSRILGDCAKEIRGTRPHAPLDLLLKMSSSRKTTFVDRFEVVRGGKTVMAAVHWHKSMNLRDPWQRATA